YGALKRSNAGNLSYLLGREKMKSNSLSTFRRKNRFVSLVLILALLVTSIPFWSPASAYASSVSVQLNRVFDVDVMLAVGNASQDISSYEADLKAKLEQLGIPTDRIKVSAVQATTVSSETSSASDIVNGWKAVPIGTQTNAAI